MISARGSNSLCKGAHVKVFSSSACSFRKDNHYCISWLQVSTAGGDFTSGPTSCLLPLLVL